MPIVQFTDKDRSCLETEVCDALQDLQFPCQLRENSVWTENVIHSLSSKESLQLAKDLLMHLRVKCTNLGKGGDHKSGLQANEVSSLEEITSWNDFLTCSELSCSMPVSSWMLTPLHATEAISGKSKQVMIRLEVIYFLASELQRLRISNRTISPSKALQSTTVSSSTLLCSSHEAIGDPAASSLDDKNLRDKEDGFNSVETGDKFLFELMQTLSSDEKRLVKEYYETMKRDYETRRQAMHKRFTLLQSYLSSRGADVPPLRTSGKAASSVTATCQKEMDAPRKSSLDIASLVQHFTKLHTHNHSQIITDLERDGSASKLVSRHAASNTTEYDGSIVAERQPPNSNNNAGQLMEKEKRVKPFEWSNEKKVIPTKQY